MLYYIYIKLLNEIYDFALLNIFKWFWKEVTSLSFPRLDYIYIYTIWWLMDDKTRRDMAMTWTRPWLMDLLTDVYNQEHHNTGDTKWYLDTGLSGAWHGSQHSGDQEHEVASRQREVLTFYCFNLSGYPYQFCLLVLMGTRLLAYLYLHFFWLIPRWRQPVSSVVLYLTVDRWLPLV